MAVGASLFSSESGRCGNCAELVGAAEADASVSAVVVARRFTNQNECRMEVVVGGWARGGGMGDGFAR